MLGAGLDGILSDSYNGLHSVENLRGIRRAGLNFGSAETRAITEIRDVVLSHTREVQMAKEGDEVLKGVCSPR